MYRSTRSNPGLSRERDCPRGYAAAVLCLSGHVDERGGHRALTGTVSLQLGVYSPDGLCLLYEELVSGIDLTTSGGAFAVEVGSAQGDPKRTRTTPASRWRRYSRTWACRSALRARAAVRVILPPRRRARDARDLPSAGGCSGDALAGSRFGVVPASDRRRDPAGHRSHGLPAAARGLEPFADDRATPD